MSYLKSFEHYNIQNDILLKLLDTYKLIGQNDYIKETFSTKLASLEESSLYENVKSIVKLTNINVSTDRIRLIILKNSLPRNKEEEKVLNVKNVLLGIKHSSYELNESINPSDILDMLKLITKKDIDFNLKKHVAQKEQNTVRYFFLNTLKTLDEYLMYNKMEPIMASTVVIMETFNLNPFTMYNDLALILLLYYLLLRCKCYAALLNPFISQIIEDFDNFKRIISNGSINYDRDMLLIHETFDYILTLISNDYKTLLNEAKLALKNKKFPKSETIKNCILRELPKTFSKEDITKLYPEISSITITRVLIELKENKYIIPLGTGRSAKWQRIIDIDDPHFMFEQKKESEEDE